ncbi:hypothetical protein A9308_00730 [Moraxella atlantae]|uniref:Uncharacterized protein n=1 Tax=Faucicola atlantae TaxID=34059 RepID=A0A1B8Q904_9GAMM|nr:hypothetical protein [Moraxella atlantae]OBX73766.1 hypothetical protein A9308_00730 [Moraxella atlantae]
MLKDGKKVLIDTVLHIVTYTVAIITLVAFLCVFYAAVSRALDIEDKAERDLIENHKVWINENRVKNETE